MRYVQFILNQQKNQQIQKQILSIRILRIQQTQLIHQIQQIHRIQQIPQQGKTQQGIKQKNNNSMIKVKSTMY